LTWVKLDDRMPEHVKVASLGDRAFRAHIEALCYCAGSLTDGFIPEAVAKRRTCCGRPPRAAGSSTTTSSTSGRRRVPARWVKCAPRWGLRAAKRQQTPSKLLSLCFKKLQADQKRSDQIRILRIR
jgi:hypothetical protein